VDAKKILAAGAATLASAWALQQAYKAADYYPPTPVFWFAIGATAAVGMQLAAKAAPRALTG
jgi:hypothetical protein